jgi:predicted solute-binding protein
METKLTLKLDESIINQAKKYALKRQKSLSRLVEDYFRGLSNDDNLEETTINPIVKELSGIIGEKDIKGWESDYAKYLEQKYE